MDTEKIWNEFLKTIINKVSPMSFNLWFKNIKLVEINENTAKILVLTTEENKDQFIKSLVKLYYEIIKENIDNITNMNCNLEFITELPKKPQIDTIDKNIEKEQEYKYNNNFNPKYTFETFVVGDSNRLAYGTALTVAKKPGKLYNPFFIHGKSGLGKTHLMHAIGNYIIKNSDLRVLYITAEQFSNDYTSILNYKSGNNTTYLDAFRNKYRNIDVLMIDDIQFLASRPKSQIEFTNTFNTLYDNEKQIIIASDTSINDFNNLADRLKTRFLGGLTECISPPDIELKKQILINKIRINDYDINISEDIIDYIAKNCGTDVRNLEGAILRLVAYKAMFNETKITLENAKEIFDEFTKDTTRYRKTTISKIIEIVSNYYGLDVSMLKGKMRKKKVVTARSVAIYLARIKTYETVERIGLEFGGKDHSTVVYWSNKITEEIKTNLELANDIEILSEKICE